MIAVIGAIYCLRSDRLHKDSQKEIKNSNLKLQRILLTSVTNTIGSYTIVNSDSYTKYCENIDINLYSTETDLAASHEKLSSYFSNGRDNLIAQDWKGFFTATIHLYITNFIFLLFSIYLFLWTLIFLLCSSCCNCCASSINKTGDPIGEKILEKGCCRSNSCRKCMYITNFLIIAGMSVMLILWYTKFMTAINSIDIVYCGTATIFNSILNGINSSEFQFAGFNGFKFIVQTALAEVDSTLSTSEALNIVNRDLPTTANALTPSLLTFYNNFKDYTVKDPVNGTTDLKSVSVESLTTQIDSIIGIEYDKLTEIGTGISAGAVILNNMLNAAEYTDFKDGISGFITQFDSMKTMFTTYDTLIHTTVDLPGKKPIISTILNLGAFVMLGIAF